MPSEYLSTWSRQGSEPALWNAASLTECSLVHEHSAYIAGPMKTKMKTIVFIHNHRHKLAFSEHWINRFIFLNTQRLILGNMFYLVNFFFINFSFLLYDQWCFKATQAKGLISQHLWFHDRNLGRKTLSNGNFTLILTAAQNKDLCTLPQYPSALGHP